MIHFLEFSLLARVIKIDVLPQGYLGRNSLNKITILN